MKRVAEEHSTTQPAKRRKLDEDAIDVSILFAQRFEQTFVCGRIAEKWASRETDEPAELTLELSSSSRLYIEVAPQLAAKVQDVRVGQRMRLWLRGAKIRVDDGRALVRFSGEGIQFEILSGEKQKRLVGTDELQVEETETLGDSTSSSADELLDSPITKRASSKSATSASTTRPLPVAPIQSRRQSTSSRKLADNSADAWFNSPSTKRASSKSKSAVSSVSAHSLASPVQSRRASTSSIPRNPSPARRSSPTPAPRATPSSAVALLGAQDISSGTFTCVVELHYKWRANDNKSYSLYITDYTRLPKAPDCSRRSWCPAGLGQYFLQLELLQKANDLGGDLDLNRIYVVPNVSMKHNRYNQLEGVKYDSEARIVAVDEEHPRDREGTGGPDGIVLPLQYEEDGPYDVAYTLPVLFGDPDTPQNLSLQVDTGSSDLWVASTSCSSSSCHSTPLYDPSVSGTGTSANFSIEYLVGSVSGPIYWDTVTVGNYSIANQALAAANEVNNEPLTSDFSGIIGLALPADSFIAQQIPPQVGDTPDGAVWASNLFSITPDGAAPAAPFLSLALERPGSATIPSVLGIGRHPAAVISDPSKVEYDMLYAPTADGPLFWKAAVRAITVYTETTTTQVQIGRGASGTAYPAAVLDTGMPVILTTTTVADQIYGALSISQSKDGNYYIPCTTPLNMTFTLDERPEMAVHPLDLSAMPSADASDQSLCTGLIQASASATLSDPDSGIGDLILGVPFLRNVYTVMAYDVPETNGTFLPYPLRVGPGSNGTTTTTTTATTTAAITNTTSFSDPIRPRLGLLGLTNATVALEEFHTVRVLNQPLSDGPTPAANTAGGGSGGKKGIHSVGIDVLVGLGSFVGVCVVLFLVRWVLVRRHLRRAGDYDLAMADKRPPPLGGYRDAEDADEDELRRPTHAYMHSVHTVSTDRTQIDRDPIPEETDKDKDKDVHHVVVPFAVVEPTTPLPVFSFAPHERSSLMDAQYDEDDQNQNPNRHHQRQTSMAGIGTARHRESISSSSRSARGRSLSGRTPTDERDAFSFPPSSSRSPERDRDRLSLRPGQVRRVSAGGESLNASIVGQAL
ncbi:Peptidase A1 domain-containing protein [Mycena chlorophos]|uniref:Peptidase A1 domain-containing protein n=1 Tax=Mycena chlorophos TaxID=658473 RepID=A0A8H6TSN6_MYCCL|nr:Peptidase A1 domain-containing protein [Mycena chlorophos]